MHELKIPPGRLIRPEGKLGNPAPTHDEFGNAYDPLNAAKGIGHTVIVMVLIIAIIAGAVVWFS